MNMLLDHRISVIEKNTYKTKVPHPTLNPIELECMQTHSCAVLYCWAFILHFLLLLLVVISILEKLQQIIKTHYLIFKYYAYIWYLEQQLNIRQLQRHSLTKARQAGNLLEYNF